jgi:hypothetical protein
MKHIGSDRQSPNERSILMSKIDHPPSGQSRRAQVQSVGCTSEGGLEEQKHSKLKGLAFHTGQPYHLPQGLCINYFLHELQDLLWETPYTIGGRGRWGRDDLGHQSKYGVGGGLLLKKNILSPAETYLQPNPNTLLGPPKQGLEERLG